VVGNTSPLSNLVKRLRNLKMQRAS
jgi:hypothetical protein